MRIIKLDENELILQDEQRLPWFRAGLFILGGLLLLSLGAAAFIPLAQGIRMGADRLLLPLVIPGGLGLLAVVLGLAMFLETERLTRITVNRGGDVVRDHEFIHSHRLDQLKPREVEAVIIEFPFAFGRLPWTTGFYSRVLLQYAGGHRTLLWSGRSRIEYPQQWSEFQDLRVAAAMADFIAVPLVTPTRSPQEADPRLQWKHTLQPDVASAAGSVKDRGGLNRALPWWAIVGILTLVILGPVFVVLLWAGRT